MNCSVVSEILAILLTALRRDFSIALGPEVILPRSANAPEDLKNGNHIVCIGSSIMQQLIPFLQASDYTVTDLTQPGWLATEENINILICKMSELKIDPGFSVVLDLFATAAIDMKILTERSHYHSRMPANITWLGRWYYARNILSKEL
jgi:hypothetical protein